MKEGRKDLRIRAGSMRWLRSQVCLTVNRMENTSNCPNTRATGGQKQKRQERSVQERSKQQKIRNKNTSRVNHCQLCWAGISWFPLDPWQVPSAVMWGRGGKEPLVSAAPPLPWKGEVVCSFLVVSLRFCTSGLSWFCRSGLCEGQHFLSLKTF